MRIEDLPRIPQPTWEEQLESSWVRFTEKAREAFSDNWWTARDALDKLAPGDLPEPVQFSASKAISLGMCLKHRRGGWTGPLRLESGGSGKSALRWRLRTLDEVL